MPSIPAYSGNDPAIKALIETVETMAGQRGKPGSDSRAPTYKELVASGVISLDSKGQPIKSESTSTGDSADDKFQKWLETKGASSGPRAYSYEEDTQLDAGQSGSAITNTGAHDAIILTMPEATLGLSFVFLRSALPFSALQYITLKPSPGDRIWNPSTNAPLLPNQRVRMDSKNAVIRLTCFEKGHWAIEYQSGTFVVTL